ncbi:MAG: hypothetical protein WC531_00790 [Candidatus Paceibacterota bacterium]|jgi:type III secretory pathway component EscS
MDNENKSSEVKTKNITLGLVASWVIGFCLIVFGVTSLGSSPVASLLSILVGIFILPSASNFIQKKFKFTMSRGIKILVVCIVLVVIGSAESNNPSKLIKSSNSKKIASSAKEVVKPEAIKITATALAEAYKSNEVAADAKYKNKLVEVSGFVDSIGKDILDSPYITLSTGQYSVTFIQCFFSKADEPVLAKFSKGQSLRLEGEVSGLTLISVVLKGCRAVE